MQLEARFLAQRIRELRQEGYAYGDMVILLRSLKSSRDIVIRELEAAGIPISAEGAGGSVAAGSEGAGVGAGAEEPQPAIMAARRVSARSRDRVFFMVSTFLSEMLWEARVRCFAVNSIVIPGHKVKDRAVRFTAYKGSSR